MSNDIAAEVFDDVLYTETNESGDKICFRTSKPVRKIDWQAHRNTLGEHVAGPFCEDIQSYNGTHISAEEMRTCTTVQCLIEKAGRVRDWLPARVSEPDEEEFERESKYFLSGLGDKIGSWEDDAFCSPMRHNVDELDPALGNRRGFTSGDMPFHPYCLEIYRRILKYCIGTVDMDGLAEWWNESQEELTMPMHAAVQRGRAGWWQHCTGDEFLAATPLQIPARKNIKGLQNRELSGRLLTLSSAEWKGRKRTFML